VPDDLLVAAVVGEEGLMKAAALAVLAVLVAAPAAYAGDLDPGAASPEAERYDVFQRGSNGSLMYGTWQKAGVGSPTWTNLGGVIKGGPDALSFVHRHVEVFARGTDNNLYHRWLAGGNWVAWDALGGPVDSDPAAVASFDMVHFFVRGTGNNILHRFWVSGEPFWRPGWEDLGGQWKGSPDAASITRGHWEVFTRGLDDAIWHNYFVNGRWSGWRSLGKPSVGVDSDPAATASPAGNVYLFVRGADHQIWFRWLDLDGRWRDWESLGGQAIGSPDAAHGGNSVIGVFARSETNHHIYQKTIVGRNVQADWFQWPGSTP
jgi:hypothetical protein